MGLELEPVIVSTQNQIGCRIKDYFIDTDHIGIDKEYLMNNVHVGDIIYDINGEKVHTYKFLDILNLLKCLKDTERIIGFKNLTYNTPTNSATNTPSKSTNKVDVSNIVLNNSVSPKSVPSTNNSPRFIKQGSNIKRKKIVKSNENSPVTTAAQSDSKTTVLDAVSNTIEAAAENVLVTVVPRFSLLEMNEVINSKNELLNELSKTTVLLGISEEKYKTLEKHNIELQQAYADMMVLTHSLTLTHSYSLLLTLRSGERRTKTTITPLCVSCTMKLQRYKPSLRSPQLRAVVVNRSNKMNT